MPKNEHRLPDAVRPLHYRLRLEVTHMDITTVVDEDGSESIVQNPYTGSVSIDLDVVEATNRIVLNAKELEIESATLSGSTQQAVDAVIVDEENEQTTLVFPETLPAGKPAALEIVFESVLVTPTEARGLYYSVFEYDGAERLMVTTQFEPTAARRCFPCFDEPALKATFSVTIVAPADRTVLSNTDPIETIDLENGMQEIQFDTTPKMSTYLLAVIVGDLASKEQTTKGGTIMRVWAVPDRIDMCDYSLDLAVRTLDYLEDYFKIKFPLSKLDNVAIPDFKAGAMENWGLVTYREFGLMVPDDATIAMKKWATGVVPHEFVHQWFGNLVTMFWWDNLWLNESFASFVGDLCVAALFPEWNWWDDFVASDTVSGKNLDSLRSSHAIEVPVADARQIDEIFDAISYSKGASVLRMLHEYVGAETFRKGVVRYLRENAYGNAKTEDLLSAIEIEAKQPIVDLFVSWISQVGFPVLSVERDGKTLTLTQERFLLDRDPEQGTGDTTLWPIPVIYTEDGVEHKLILDTTTTTVELNDADSAVLINPGQSGFYRTAYRGEMLNAVAESIAAGNVAVIDRIGIYDDAYMLLRAGYLDLNQYLMLVDAARGETNHLVWRKITDGVLALLELFGDHPGIDAFRKWCRGIFGPVAAKLGWQPGPNEHDDVTQLRPLMQGAAADTGDPEAIAVALQLFEEASGSIESFVETISADLRPVVTRIAMRESGRPAFETIKSHQQAAQAAAGRIAPDVELRLVQTLGAPHDEALLLEALQYALSENVRGNDAAYAFGGIDISMKRAAWKHFTEELWDTIFERYGDDRSIGSFIAGAAAGFASHDHADAVEAFFKENPVPAAERKIDQILEGIRARADFVERSEESFTKFVNGISE